MNKRVGAVVVFNSHFQNGETTCYQLSKILPDNSTIFVAEATTISLALGYYQDMDLGLKVEAAMASAEINAELVPIGGVLAVTCFGLKINELPSCIAKDIFKALFVDDLAIWTP